MIVKLLLCMLAAALLVACAAEPPAPPAAPASAFVELENPANLTRIALKRGGELKLLLDTDLQRSQQWYAASEIGPVLSPIGERASIGKTYNIMDLTAGGWNIFRYRAEQPGKITLRYDLRRNDVEVPTIKTLRYEVTVE